MKRNLKFIIIGIFSLSFLSLQAQQPLVLSLDSAVSYAINHNKMLKNSKYAIDKSSQQLKETISKGLPQVAASLDYTNFLGAEASLELGPGAPPAIIKFNPTSNFKVNASQLIFNGNYIVGIQISKLAKKMTEQSYQKDELDVKEQTIQTYYTILAGEQILKTLKENRKNAKAIYEQTENMASAGVIEQIDAKKLSIMVTSVDNAVKSAQRQVELAYNLLRFNLGLSGDQTIKLSTSLNEVAKQFRLRMGNNIQNSFNIQNNLNYKLVSLQVEMTKESVNMAKTSYLPSLVAIYSYTYKIKKPNFDFTPKNVLGFTLSIPVFSGGLRLSKLNQAKIDYNISKNTKALLTDQLTLQERQLKYNYENLLEQYINQKANVKIAKEVLDKMELKFQQGIVSSLDLTSANNDYLTAETDFTGTLLKLLNADLALRKLNNDL